MYAAGTASDDDVPASQLLLVEAKLWKDLLPSAKLCLGSLLLQ